MVKYCNKCDVEYEEDVEYCTDCGSKLKEKPIVNHCASCGTKITKAIKYCTECGAELKPAKKKDIEEELEEEETEDEEDEEAPIVSHKGVKVKQGAPHVDTKVEVKTESGGFLSGIKWGSGCCIGIILAIIIIFFVVVVIFGYSIDSLLNSL